MDSARQLHHGTGDVRTAIICGPTAWSLYSLRLNLMRALKERGFDVIAAGPPDRHAALFAPLGIRYAPIPMSLTGLNPLTEARSVFHLWRLYRQVRPALVHHSSHKPILYGSIAARAAGVPAILNTVNGLGSTLGEASGLLRLLQPLIRLASRHALRPPVRVSFQNPELRDFYIRRRLVRPEQTSVILGSGVDPELFQPIEDTGAAAPTRPLRFLMFSRMLWAKGVAQYCAASRLVAARHAGAEFWLIGGATAANDTSVDQEWLANPDSIPGTWLENEAQSGPVRWLPHQRDIIERIRAADVVVLPSYYSEGVPRSLLEAMSCAKAIVTTDSPGCRDVVEPGVNGLLVRARDVASLADAMSFLIDHPQTAREMGSASRRILLERFSDRHVVDQTMEEYARAGVPL